MDEILKKFPLKQEIPKLNGRCEAKKSELHVQNQVLRSQLRLAHVKEVEQEIKQICAEYMDVFKLPDDKLTVPSAIKQYIPTPMIPTNRSIPLRNYRIHYQNEVDAQIQQMLENKIIQPSHSHFQI
jgi:hypothetical protein